MQHSKKPAAEQKTLFQSRWDWLDENLSPIDDKVKHLLRVLFSHTPEEKTDSWPSLETLRREMSMKSIKAVRYTVSKAVEAGYVLVLPPHSVDKRRKTNTYRLRIAEIREAAEIEKAIRIKWNANRDGCQEKFAGDFLTYLDHEKTKVTLPKSEPDIAQAPCQKGNPTPAKKGTRPLPKREPDPCQKGNPEHPIEPNIEHPMNEADGGKSDGGWDDPIELDQMTDPCWLEKRFEEAVRKKWLGKSRYALEQFLALSRYCRIAAKKNPGGFFTTLLKKKEFTIARDEDRKWAREQLDRLYPAKSQAQQMIELQNKFGNLDRPAEEQTQ